MLLISQGEIYTVGKYFHTYYKKKHWILLSYLNVTGNIEFENTEQASNYFNRSDTQRYSIINEIGNTSGYGDFFEFILEYPTKNRIIHFKRTNYPLYGHGYNGKTNVKGFQMIYPPNMTSFSGLAKSMEMSANSCAPSVFDGSIGITNFHWCVGLSKCPTTWSHSTIPMGFGEKGTDVMSLWMRIKMMIHTCVQSKQFSLPPAKLLFFIIWI